MKYKIGDEVLIKGRIHVVDHTDRDYPYEVRIDEKAIENLWVSEDMIAESKTYSQGLADAWELAKKICALKNADFDKVFGCVYFADVFCNFTYEEALAKIEAYERENEIKVGDVVRRGYFLGLVIRVFNQAVDVIYKDGSTGTLTKTIIEKTGKHIDIEGLLRQIGE